MPPAASDRRAALKARHREAIVASAAALMAERQGAGFTVDDVAERADVARRTVFNHFGSVDDLMTEVCADLLGALVDRLLESASAAPVPPDGDPAGSPRPTSMMFDEVAHALRETDLVGPMAYLTRVLGPPEVETPARMVLLHRSIADLSGRFGAALTARHPTADPLEVDLLVNSLVSGLTVLYHHWYAATGAAEDDGSRAEWARLVERLIGVVRAGYAAPGG